MGRPLPPEFAAAGPTPLPPPVTAHAIEVVQVIQDLSHSVSLIARKKTVARVYLALPDGGNVGVRGELRVFNASGVELRVPSLAAVEVGALPGGLVQSLREDFAKSLNFMLPADATLPGSATVELLSLQREGDGVGVPVNARSVAVKFVDAPPLRVKFFGVRYKTSKASAWIEPAEVHFRMAVSWLERAYPTHEVITTRLVIDAPKLWPFLCDDVNALLAGIRRQDMSAGGDPRTHYFGLVDDRNGGNFMRGCATEVPDHPAPDTVASGPAGTANFGWDFDGSYADWYSAHELGHTFGRNHPGFCNNNSAHDPKFPFPDGHLSPPDGQFVGLDVGDPVLGLPMLALPGQTWTDVMTYCEKEWMCSYTFEGILTRLREENVQPGPLVLPLAAGLELMAAQPAAQPRSTVGKLGHLLAIIEMDAQERPISGKIRSFAALQRGVPSREFPKSPARIDFLRADETVMATRALRVKVNTCCEGRDHRHGMIDAVVEIPEGAARIRLRLNDTPADEWIIASPPGSLREMSVRSARAVIESVAPEDDRARYIVQTSRDGGATWETIAVNVEADQWELQKRNYPGLSKILVRIISSTGVTTNSRVTEVPLE